MSRTCISEYRLVTHIVRIHCEMPRSSLFSHAKIWRRSHSPDHPPRILRFDKSQLAVCFHQINGIEVLRHSVGDALFYHAQTVSGVLQCILMAKIRNRHGGSLPDFSGIKHIEDRFLQRVFSNAFLLLKGQYRNARRFLRTVQVSTAAVRSDLVHQDHRPFSLKYAEYLVLLRQWS